MNMQFDILTLHPEAFGLDLSDFSLKIAKLKRTAKGIVLASFGEFPVPEGLMEQGEIKKEKELQTVIQNALQKVQGEKLQTKRVIASLPEEKAFLRVIQLPKLKPEEVAQAVVFQAENYIPYSLETVYLDSQVVHPLKNHLDHTDVLLASLSRTTVNAHLSLLQGAGLQVQALEIESLAQARALVHKESSLVPLLLVDLGATRTSFIVFAGTSLRFTASLPISSQEFTHAVARAMGVDADKAEELKRTHGLDSKEDPEGRQVLQALTPSLRQLVLQIKKYLDYYETHATHQHMTKEEKEIKKIILAGGGANLKGLPEFLAKELKAQTLQGNPWVNILQTPPKVLPPLSFEESLRYSTALGLALRGLNSTT